MNILTVIFSLGKGGTERTAVNFAIAYKYLGNDSRVLYTEKTGERYKRLDSEGICVYDLKNTSSLEKIRNWKPDIVHIHSLAIKFEDFELIYSMFKGAIFIETNVFSLPSPWAKKIDVSLQLSSWCNWLFQKRTKGKYRSAIVPNAIDTDAFYPVGESRVESFKKKYSIPEEYKLLGRVGQSNEGKWSEKIIDVFESLRVDYYLKLLLVDPSLKVIKRVEKSKFKNDIIIIDKIYEDDILSELYSSIDVFVHIANIGESFGMVLVESMLCETPIVSLATPWADNSQCEVILQNSGGYVVGNINEFIFEVKRLLDDKNLRISIGKQARIKVIDSYNMVKIAKRAIVAASKSTSIEYDNNSIPLNIMKSINGKLNIPTKIILKSERWFWLLRYTMGYAKLHSLPIHIIRHFLH